jgi:hypothetical protein
VTVCPGEFVTPGVYIISDLELSCWVLFDNHD